MCAKFGSKDTSYLSRDSLFGSISGLLNLNLNLIPTTRGTAMKKILYISLCMCMQYTMHDMHATLKSFDPDYNCWFFYKLISTFLIVQQDLNLWHSLHNDCPFPLNQDTNEFPLCRWDLIIGPLFDIERLL